MLRVRKRFRIIDGRGTTIIITIETTPKAKRISVLCNKPAKGTTFKEPVLLSAKIASEIKPGFR
jgi:hypothetical protein